MRIVIPSETDQLLDAPRSGHFGHAPWMTVVELDETGQVTSMEAVKNVEHGEGGCGNVIMHVMDLKADAIITAGMGMPPLMRFTQAGIVVYADRSVLTVGEVLALFVAGQVAQMSPDDACRH
ncbi:MAG: NifB/NifX family molybdenum-iron cluster-binding protein [Coriobacteriales bacterium]|nr:NifB/NifX family molybdenum-iron cluster-binding protein [Coriobacteriales bacterium]